MKTAIVIGATGLIGKHLTKLLLNNPMYSTVKVFVRRSLNISDPKLEEHIVNFDEIENWKEHIIGDELFELMYSFYPEVIELEKRNNSGFILLEKGASEQNFNIIRTFEPDGSPEWIQNQQRIKVDSVSGNHTYYYNDSDEFGTSVEFEAGSDLITKNKITILVDFMIEEQLAEALLVFTTDRTGKMQVYQTLNISQFAKYPDNWNRAVYEIKIAPEIQEGDIIKIYFWNLRKAKFQIDNLKIKYSGS